MPLPSVRPGPQTDRVSSFRKWGVKGRTGAIHKVSKHLLVGGGQNGLSERGGVNLRTRERRGLESRKIFAHTYLTLINDMMAYPAFVQDSGPLR